MNHQIEIDYAVPYPHAPKPPVIEAWVNAALKQEQRSFALSIKIIDEAEMTSLNHAYRNKNKPTNVLSFPCLLPEHFRGNQLGDIAICGPIVEKEAALSQIAATAHWAHLIVHGVLHLLGYDHEEESEAATMEALETAILKDLGFQDPYLVEQSHA